MITIGAGKSILGAVKRLRAIQGADLPKVVAISLSNCAKIGRSEARQYMGSAFDRPTPYARNALYFVGAQKSDGLTRMKATVWLKDGLGTKGPSAADYILPQVEGGNRKLKRSELHLQRIGLLPKGMYIVPGMGAKLDRYGNMNRGQMQKILSALSAQRDVGVTSNITARSRKRNPKRVGYKPFFDQSGKVAGIREDGYGYKKGGKPVLVFVRSPVYRERYPFHKIVQNAVHKNLQKQFDMAWRREVNKRG